MYYILIETQNINGTKTVSPLVYDDIATANYMGVMLMRNDGMTILPMVKGPIAEEA